MILVMSGVVLGIWRRNHAILRDEFDYSIVIAAAGKVEAGYKPYTDIPSPMQSSVYLLNYFSERLFGRSYLGLTVGGLVQALGGGLVLLAMLRRPLGGWMALSLAMAVVLAGLLQHMVFFYNPVGILCFSVVLLGLAVEPALWPVRSGRGLVILAALFLSGINKVNFHGVTMVLAGLLSVSSVLVGRMTVSAFIRNSLLLLFFGGVLPVAFELIWTGATYAQWIDNVILGPTARHDYLTHLLASDMYLRPVHDFYSHILVRSVGGIGLVLLAVTGAWVIFSARSQRRPSGDWAVRFLLVLFGCAAGAALMVTNHETVLLTSLVYPVFSVVLYLQYHGRGRAADQGIRGILIVGTLVWAVAGGYAAWHGSRLLYGQNPPPREAYIDWSSEHPSLAYFAGVRMLPAHIDARQRTAARLSELEDARGDLPDILFGQGQEWFERYYRGAIVRHAPIWLHAGTTLHDRDRDSFLRVLNHGERRLLVQIGWQSWPPPIREMLDRLYIQEVVGSRDLLYHPRGPRPPAIAAIPPVSPTPLDFRAGTDSNVAISATRYSEGMTLQAGRDNPAFGDVHNTNWSWPLGSNALHGQAVARLASGVEKAGAVTFRIMTDDPESGRLVWQMLAAVGPGQLEAAIPFSLYTGCRPMWLQTIVPSHLAGLVFAGWRQLRITHSNEQDRSLPPPFSAGLRRIEPAAGQDEADELWYAADPQVSRSEAWVGVPAENWRRQVTRSGVVRVTVSLQRTAAKSGELINVTLAWYRAGRFEIMTERLVDPSNTATVTLEAPVTEPGGWVGVLTRHGSRGDMMQITAWEN